MTNIRLTMEYDGTNYKGWQRQPGKQTIQGSLEYALKKIAKEEILTFGASRTDAGVHALCQTVTFDTKTGIPLKNLHIALNNFIPDDIYILKIEKAKAGFHARHSAKIKTYRYTVHNEKERKIFLKDIVWHWQYPLDLKKMRAAAKYLLGRHDYRPFSCDEERENTLRTVDRIKISKKKGMVYIDVTAKSFLRRQVRMMAGFLVQAGGSRVKPEVAKEIFKGTTGVKPLVAPACGLCLTKIKY
ncbi:MAG: tRNA pseudouridine(38-40) synthase TruA [Candidatus Firestonebacteria bacterium RIFOXYA2_FULL_40_8]|nr:MAG: tRNA pseudouridine(38-40) synthase TruA [Candidatus Firestonebacteria bacterium RIFOXYA2_FULL_40_8]